MQLTFVHSQTDNCKMGNKLYTVSFKMNVRGRTYNNFSLRLNIFQYLELRFNRWTRCLASLVFVIEMVSTTRPCSKRHFLQSFYKKDFNIFISVTDTVHGCSFIRTCTCPKPRLENCKYYNHQSIDYDCTSSTF